MTLSQRLRTCAKHTGLDAVIELLQEAADEIDALQARAQVQGEPVYWEWRHLGSNQFAADFGQWSEWKRVEARNPIFTAEDELRTLRRYIADGYKYELRALYTAPQATPVCGAQNAESDPQAPLSLTAAPQQATPDDMKVYASIADRYFREAAQADVKDEQILEIAEPFGEFQYGDAQGHKRIDFARAILALRHERGPMTCHCHTCRPITMGDMRMVLCPKCGNKRCPHANDHRNDCTGSNEPGQPGSAYPAPHGITAQAEKGGA